MFIRNGKLVGNIQAT